MRWKEYRENFLKYYVITQLEEKIQFSKNMSQFLPGMNLAQNTIYPDKCEIRVK